MLVYKIQNNIWPDDYNYLPNLYVHLDVHNYHERRSREEGQGDMSPPPIFEKSPTDFDFSHSKLLEMRSCPPPPPPQYWEQIAALLIIATTNSRVVAMSFFPKASQAPSHLSSGQASQVSSHLTSSQVTSHFHPSHFKSQVIFFKSRQVTSHNFQSEKFSKPIN